MWRDFDNWENFPTRTDAHRSQPNSHWFDQAVNRFAARYLDVVIAGAQFFYVTLLLVYLALSFGIIS